MWSKVILPSKRDWTFLSYLIVLSVTGWGNIYLHSDCCETICFWLLTATHCPVGSPYLQFKRPVLFYRWVFVWEKGYQETDSVVSSVTVKAKGVTMTNTSKLGFRIWDVADYVIPAQVSLPLWLCLLNFRPLVHCFPFDFAHLTGDQRAQITCPDQHAHITSAHIDCSSPRKQYRQASFWLRV